VEKLRFSTEIDVYLDPKRCEIGRRLLWTVNRKSQVADRSVSVLITLINP